MRPSWKPQFSMGTLMMFVLAAASASGLFVKLHQLRPLAKDATWAIDAPTIFLLATVLTGIALAAWKGHSVTLTMLQVTLACLGWLALIWVVEAGYHRAARYWFEGTFAAAAVVPLVARRAVKSSLPRGPRRDRWKRVCEAVSFSSLNMLLVTAGVLLQLFLYYEVVESLLPAPSAVSAPSTK
jgi:hypothetical protein